MIQLACAFKSGVRSPFSSAARRLATRPLPSCSKLANSRTHCGRRPEGQSAATTARARASSTRGKYGDRVWQTASAFSTSARDSSGGRTQTVGQTTPSGLTVEGSGATWLTRLR